MTSQRACLHWELQLPVESFRMMTFIHLFHRR